MSFLNAELVEIGKYSPFLANLIVYSLYAAVIIVALVPISFLSWIVSKSATGLFEFVRLSLESFAGKCDKVSKKLFARARRTVSDWVRNSSSFVEYENPSFTFDTSSLQEEINQLQSELPHVREAIKDQEGDKATLVEQLHSKLSHLERDLNPLSKVEIPELEIDAKYEYERKKSLAIIYVFVVIVAIAALVNGLMVAEFFANLGVNDRIFKQVTFLTQDKILGFLFCIIEISIGLLITTFSIEKNQKSEASGNFLYISVLWLGTASLAAVEAVFYGMVGVAIAETGMSFGAVLVSYDLDTYIEHNLVLALIGPVLVVVLAFSGKVLSEAYFNYSKFSVFNKFRDELNAAHNQQENLLSAFRSADEELRGLLLDIKAMDISLNNLDRAADLKILSRIEHLISNLNSSCDKASKITGPALAHVKLDGHESTNLILSKGVIGLIPLASFLVFSFLVPAAEYFSVGDRLLALSFDLATAVLFVGGCYFAGYMFTRNVTVLRRQSESSSYLLSAKQDGLGKVLALSILLLAVAGTYVILSQSGFSLPQLVTSLFGLCVAFYCGRDFILSAAVMGVIGRALLALVLSVVSRLNYWLASTFAFIVDVIHRALDALAFPANRAIDFFIGGQKNA